MVHTSSLLTLRREQSTTKVFKDGASHRLWWRQTCGSLLHVVLAYPGAPAVHIEGMWHHLQRVGGPSTISLESVLHLETAIGPDQGEGAPVETQPKALIW